jgi:hypothetical protein
MTLTTYAQKDVTKFLGIPVDGTKNQMIQKLKAKGFVSSSWDKDVLEGQFNGAEVNIHIVTNNNKVWRIAVFDAHSIDWEKAIIRYNILLSQFKNKSDKYSTINGIEITEHFDETAKYVFDVMVEANNYLCFFVQESEKYVMEKIRPNLLTKYTNEQLNNPDLQTYSNICLQKIDYFKSSPKKVYMNIFEEKPEEYCIALYYDNDINNKNNGEDL